MMSSVCWGFTRWINFNCKFTFFLLRFQFSVFIQLRIFLLSNFSFSSFTSVTPFPCTGRSFAYKFIAWLLPNGQRVVNEKCERSKCDSILVNWPLLIISKRCRPSAGQSFNTFALSFIILIPCCVPCLPSNNIKNRFIGQTTGTWFISDGRSFALMQLVWLIKH